MPWDFLYESILENRDEQSTDGIIMRYDLLVSEANMVREKDKSLIKNIFKDFYHKKLGVGIGFQRAFGSILSGDYFDLIPLADGNYLFVFADISGHGLPAYTTLIRLRSALALSVREIHEIYSRTRSIDPSILVRTVTKKFTDIMENDDSHDFACVNFVFIYNQNDRFYLKFYNRSMLFPIVVRKFNRNLVDVFNLNMEDKGWFPQKGHLVGSDIRRLLGDRYYETPSCEFIVYEGDWLLFFSDGIVEAYPKENPMNEFGQKRIEKLLVENINRGPQEMVDLLFHTVYNFIGRPENQKDDMTAVLIDFPLVRK
ncbi:MAG TPA: PP2C family protein-serine/threonine phosphatase [Spirochaetota bacterium]|nr:PP2C family protein-serine/threonine phosphatase [Spirochaetota bacterium]HPI90161.1 PP2C family protein-serine/threonine phosphatase [Spirochaetota bacterium]HPR48920.1 PP2C family protein-serine/threonine phosphatase [Spirochaetota bacterium]